jgi:transcriptional regulator with XRE-family HTH domain
MWHSDARKGLQPWGVDVPRDTLEVNQSATIGGRIREAMKEAGVKNAAVAEAADVHLNTVSQWLNNKFPPSDEALASVAALLRVSEAWLRYGDQPVTPRQRPTQVNGTDGPSLPQKIRERIKEIELDLVRMEADDDLVAGFGQSMRANPGFMSLFSGGAPANLNAEGTMQLLEAFAANYINIVRMAMDRRKAEPSRE